MTELQEIPKGQDGSREVRESQDIGPKELDFIESFHMETYYRNQLRKKTATPRELRSNNDYPTLSLEDMKSLVRKKIAQAQEERRELERELSEMN